jgi:hypothetical protein
VRDLAFGMRSAAAVFHCPAVRRRTVRRIPGSSPDAGIRNSGIPGVRPLGVSFGADITPNDTPKLGTARSAGGMSRFAGPARGPGIADEGRSQSQGTTPVTPIPKPRNTSF